MNLKFSGLGAEPKKIILLSVLGVVLVGVFIYNRSSSPSDAPVTQTQGSATPTPTVESSSHVPTRNVVARGANRAGQSRRQRSSEEFKPSLKPKRGEEDMDRSGIDPTLRLDLLAKLKSVKVEGDSRSLFDFGQAPPPVLKAAEPKPIEVKRFRTYGPTPPPPPVVAVVPPDPPAPPVTLKFYGWVNQNKPGVRRAFFLDGEDIIVASEGQTIKNRYKIVRIGVNSAVVEDTQFKNHQSTLPLVEEMTG